MKVIGWLFVVVIALRWEHLIAGAVWMKRSGKLCYDDPDFGTATTASARWVVYQRHHGGRLPWLFMGIKAHRLRAWEENRSTPLKRIRATGSFVVRRIWHFGVFGWAISLLLLGLSEVDDNSAQPYMIAAFMMLGCIFTLAIEGAISLLLVGSWGGTHHLLRHSSGRWKETIAAGGSITVAYAITVCSIWIAERQYNAFPTTATSGPTQQRIADAAQAAIGCIGQNIPQSSGQTGTYLTLALRLVWAAWTLAFLVLVTWAARATD